ncbi:ABC transporter ATP-binding protein [Herbiconiux sp. KACC 21604]|uniref:ABC transporter ATP-binding protein n=1 Tax=unclassified Herbiconiux TaxID=2618217 RepID=UPI00149255D7|nr:ABC transporter ATP-binding protein [Herbiconiux sp. SALV-R1]QJU54009.1 ABC transporter ATP-binding protein [Herbiconiux sp. SALV-R1]WPO85040.1 ABC transporter ATP-binding protein [Herbiconiux sp. KACC 21604]
MSEVPAFPGAASAAGAGIVVEGVRRAFGAVEAVRSVSFEARAGAVTALIGPNGSGKTTLLLMLATLLRPDAGRILIGGIDPVAEPRAVRPIVGWMPDALGSWNNLTVHSALAMTHRLYGHPKTVANDRAWELIHLVGLTELAARPTRVLSRGQKQKLSLARALSNDPRVLLLDEPASGLDPVARIELRELLLALAAEGRTILVSSHVLSELDELATDAVYLDHGVTASREAVARARASSRVWRVKSLDGFALGPQLEGIGVDASRIGVDSQGFTVAMTDETDAAAVLSALVAAGVQVSWFAPASGELERTMQGLRDGGAA